VERRGTCGAADAFGGATTEKSRGVGCCGVRHAWVQGRVSLKRIFPQGIKPSFTQRNIRHDSSHPYDEDLSLGTPARRALSKHIQTDVLPDLANKIKAMRYFGSGPLPRPGWRNWQTQRTQNPPIARSWGFDPPSRHQTSHIYIVVFLPLPSLARLIRACGSLQCGVQRWRPGRTKCCEQRGSYESPGILMGVSKGAGFPSKRRCE
jgi:hypothetical protein